MNLRYIDAHAHIHGKDFDIDRAEVIGRMKELDLGCITVGTSLEDSKKAVEVATNNDNVWATIGVHPTDTNEIFDEKDFEELVKSEKVVAIGECGLDYFHEKTEEGREKQKANFKKQLDFALKYELPLMIHCRPSGKTMDAHYEMIEILNEYKSKVGDKLKGNIHFFTGTKEVAEKYFELGFSVSIPGVLTFSKEVENTFKDLPIEKVLAETDCPYATPVPFRGKRNEPMYVIETMKYMAQIKGIFLEELEKGVLSNTKNTFQI